MSISRRTILTGASAALIATTAAPLVAHAAQAAQPAELRVGVQALVREIRQGLSGQIVMCTFWALQEVADRLEALPGVQAVANEHWTTEDYARANRHGMVRVLRGAGSPASPEHSDGPPRGPRDR